MASKSVKVSVCGLLSLIVVIAAYIYKKQYDEWVVHRLENTLQSLLDIEKRSAVNSQTKVAVGYGSCLDVVARSRDVLLDPFSPPKDPKHFFSITSRQELLQVFAYFFRHGAAAERYVNDEKLFKELVEKSRQSKDVQEALGGNAPVMAARFAKEGIGRVLLGAQMSEALKKLLPENIKLSGPFLASDDIHLLLEYPAGENWGSLYSAPRANRFIVHNDVNNPLISSMEKFHQELNSFGADLLVVGGLQMMDHFPSANYQRRERLQKMGALLKEVSLTGADNRQTMIHFEMASFTDEHLLQDIVDNVLPYADSLGMNEQELPNLLNMLTYGNVTLVSDAYPRVAVVLDQMRDVYSLLYKHTQGRISRIHVHTLAFQAILTRKGSSWKQSMASAAKAALTAHRHTCGSDVIDTAKAKLIMDDSFTTTRSNGQSSRRIPFNDKKPVACWDETSIDKIPFEICVAPVLVCTKALQTGGGGDNVSAAGLVLQI